jgi:hypothetical protein
MPTEKDVQQLAKLIERIEKYAAGGIYDPAKHEEIVSSIDKAETVFNRIIDGYMEAIPPIQQANEVSELQKRLHHAKHDIPSPPIKLASGARLADEQIAIYSLPT